MSEKRVKDLMAELIRELEQTDGVDGATVLSAKNLEKNIQDTINPEIDTENNTVLDDAIALEASFAASHPMAEKIIRELINTLSKIGI